MTRATGFRALEVRFLIEVPHASELHERTRSVERALEATGAFLRIDFTESVSVASTHAGPSYALTLTVRPRDPAARSAARTGEVVTSVGPVLTGVLETYPGLFVSAEVRATAVLTQTEEDYASVPTTAEAKRAEREASAALARAAEWEKRLGSEHATWKATGLKVESATAFAKAGLDPAKALAMNTAVMDLIDKVPRHLPIPRWITDFADLALLADGYRRVTEAFPSASPTNIVGALDAVSGDVDALVVGVESGMPLDWAVRRTTTAA